MSQQWGSGGGGASSRVKARNRNCQFSTRSIRPKSRNAFNLMFAVAEVQMEISLVNKTRGELFKQRGKRGGKGRRAERGMSAAGWTAEMTRKQQMAASRKLLSLAALSKCFSMFNKREERRRARGRGSQQFTFFRWGHYVRAPDAGADAPLQL